MRSSIALSLSVLLLASCKDPTTAPIAVATVSVSLSSSTLLVGETTQATAAALGSSGQALTGRPVTWSSSDPAVASVSATGLITSVKVGTTRITATIGGKSGSAPLVVVPIPVASVAIVPAIDTLTIGHTAQLGVVARDQAGNIVENQRPTWATTVPARATVSLDGLVTAIGPGAVEISATIGGVSGHVAVAIQATLPLTPIGSAATPGQVVRLSGVPASVPAGPVDGLLGGRPVRFGRLDETTLAALVPLDAPTGRSAVKVQLGPFLVGVADLVVGTAAGIDNPTRFVDSLLMGIGRAIPLIPPMGSNTGAFAAAATVARARADSARISLQLLSIADRFMVAHIFAAVPVTAGQVARPGAALPVPACEAARATLSGQTRLTVETLVLLTGILVAAAAAAALSGGLGAPAFVLTLQVIGASAGLSLVVWAGAYTLAFVQCSIVQGIEASMAGIGPSAGYGANAPTVGSLPVGGRALVTLVATRRSLAAVDIGADPVATELDAAYRSVASVLEIFSPYLSVPGLDAVVPIDKRTTSQSTRSSVDPAEATWATSNAAVASVVNGVVRGVASGQATISGAWQGRSATIDVTVIGFGSVAGTISSAQRGPLSGVTVSTGAASAFTNSNGQYQLTANVPEGPGTVTLSNLPSGCVDPGPRPILVRANATTQLNVAVICTPSAGTVTGVVTSPQRGGLGSVSVIVAGDTTLSATDGRYAFLNRVAIGSQVVAVAGLPAGCLNPGTRTVTVTANSSTTADFSVTCNVTIGGTVTSPQRGALRGVTAAVGQQQATTGPTGAYTLTATPAGAPSVQLTGLPTGCTNPGPQSVLVSQSGSGTANFTVTCQPYLGYLRVAGLQWARIESTTSSAVDLRPTAGHVDLRSLPLHQVVSAKDAYVVFSGDITVPGEFLPCGAYPATNTWSVYFTGTYTYYFAANDQQALPSRFTTLFNIGLRVTARDPRGCPTAGELFYGFESDGVSTPISF